MNAVYYKHCSKYILNYSLNIEDFNDAEIYKNQEPRKIPSPNSDADFVQIG